MSIIKVEHLTKKYGNRTIFNNVNLSIDEGEFVAIVGPSGSGKSTLLNILGMLEKPTSGEVELLGDKLPDVNSQKATMMRRAKINYLFQSFALISNETVKSNLLLAMKFKKGSKAEKDNSIDRILSKLGILDLKDSVVNTLSGGEQQRVVIARAIVNKPKLLLCDEPTGNLDPETSKEIMDVIENINKELGTTVVMATHDKDIVDRMKKRVVVVSNGLIEGDFLKGSYKVNENI